MSVWLVMGGRQFYMQGMDMSLLDQKAAKHGLLLDPGTIRSDTSGDNANASVVLDNSNGQMTALLRTLPLVSDAVLMDESGPLLAGVVLGITLDTSCKVDIQA